MGVLSCIVSLLITTPMLWNVVYKGEEVGNRTCIVDWPKEEGTLIS